MSVTLVVIAKTYPRHREPDRLRRDVAIIGRV